MSLSDQWQRERGCARETFFIFPIIFDVTSDNILFSCKYTDEKSFLPLAARGHYAWCIAFTAFILII